jgi:hypothetical protein
LITLCQLQQCHATPPPPPLTGEELEEGESTIDWIVGQSPDGDWIAYNKEEQISIPENKTREDAIIAARERAKRILEFKRSQVR